MKKLLACLSAVLLLASVLLIGVIPAAAGDETANPLLADYTTQAAYDAAVAAGKLSTGSADKAALSFDATLGAANITYKNPSGAARADEAWIYFDPMNEVAVAGNEVIVAKVKAPAGKNDQGFLTYSHKAFAGDKDIAYKNTADNNGNHWYTKAGASEVLAGEDGWLYVSYTAKADVDAAGVAADAKWGRVQVIGHGSFYQANDVFSIAWVGAFESLEAAKAWDEGDSDSTTTTENTTTTTQPTEPAGPVIPDGATEEYFYDFTQGVNTTPSDNDLYVGYEGNTKISYNADVQAMEIATADGNTSDVNMAKFQLFNGDGIPTPTEPVVSEYPYIAMKLKLATTDITPGTSIITRNDEKKAWVSLPVKYELTTDWQLVIVDGSALTDPTVWWLNIFNLINNKPANTALYDGTSETIGFVQWAGAFDSKEAAEAYFDATTESGSTTPEGGEGEGEQTTTTTKELLPVDKGEKFYFGFDTEEGYKAMSSWGNYRGQLNNAKGENSFNLDSTKWREASNLAYDAEVGGTKIVKKDDSTAPIEYVFFKRAEGIEAEYPDEYPIVGLKVKINKKALPGIFGYSAAIGGQWQWPWSTGGYTGEWQLITFTVNDYKSTVDDKSWRGLIGQLVKNPQDFANDEVIGHIAWGGVFASQEDAMNHFLNTTPDYVAPEEEEGSDSPLILDLTTKDKYDAAVAAGKLSTNNPDNAELSYSENLGAAVFTYTNGKPINDTRLGEAGFVFRATNNVKVADGKVLVVKLRYSSENYLTYSHQAHIEGTSAISYTNGTNGNFTYAANNPSMLAGNGEWVYCAYTDPDLVDLAKPAATANWVGLNITAHGSFYQEGDTFTVAWVGAFESLEAAKEFDLGADSGSTTKPTTKPTQPPAGSEEIVDRPFFVDLSTQKKYNNAVSGKWFQANTGDNTNVAVEWDASVGGVKISAANNNPANIGQMVFRNMAPAGTDATPAEYPYFVLKVKLAEGYTKGMAPASGLFASMRYGGFRAGLKLMASYQDTEEWQLLIFKGQKSYSPEFDPDSDWNGTLIGLFNDGEEVKAGDTLGWVQWAGIFETVEDAYAFSGIDPEGEDPSEIFWKFDSEDAVNKPVRAQGDTQISYDAEVGAMKIEAKDTDGDKYVAFTPGRIVLGAKKQIAGDYDVNEYPYVAFRVKIENKLQDGGGIYIRSSGSLENGRNGVIESADMLAGTVNYENISNWQTVVLRWDEDTMVKFFFTGTWKQIQFNAFSEAIGSAKEGDTAWVRWAGAFKSLEDIEEYVARTAPYEKGNTTDGAIPEPDPTQATVTTTTTTTTTEATTTTTEEITEATEPTDVEEEEKVYVVTNYPFEGDNGNWIIGDIDTQIPYDPNVEPEMGENGNWFIGGVDTGIPVEFEEYVEDGDVSDEETPDTGENTVFPIAIAVLAVMMGAAMVVFSKKNKVTE